MDWFILLALLVALLAVTCEVRHLEDGGDVEA